MFHPPMEAPKTDFWGVVFDTCLGRGLEDDILMEFDDFGVYLGVPLGDHFGIFGRNKWTFAAVPFLVKKVKRCGRGRRQRWGSWEILLKFERVRRCDSSTPCYPPSGVRRIDVRSTAADPDEMEKQSLFIS